MNRGDVDDPMTSRTSRRFRLETTILCAAVTFLEGFNAQSVGFIAAPLRHAWHMEASELGFFISFGLFGLMIGSLLVAPLADRLGRRPVIIGSTLIFGVASLSMVTLSSLPALYMMRFTTGVGLGGALPNVVALVSEFSPARRRSTMIALVMAGFAVGTLGAGLAAAALVPLLSWQSVFLVGGILPIMLVPILLWRLPESFRFLQLNGPTDARFLRLAERIGTSLPERHDHRLTATLDTVRVGVRRLFDRSLRLPTILLWTISFMITLLSYLLVSWLPTTLHSTGLSVSWAALLSLVLPIGAIVGTPFVGIGIDRYGFGPILILTFLLAAMAIASLGLAAAGITLLGAVIFILGIGVGGAQNGASAVTALTYSVELRSTGIGWAQGTGRLGSIVGPIIGGLLISAHIPLERIYLISAIPALIAAAAVYALSAIARHEKFRAAGVMGSN